MHWNMSSLKSQPSLSLNELHGRNCTYMLLECGDLLTDMHNQVVLYLWSKFGDLSLKGSWVIGTSRFTSVSQYIDTQLPQYTSQG